MPLNDAILNVGASAMQERMTYASIHAAEPDESGSGESAAARQPITWEEPAGGDLVVTDDLAFTGGAHNSPATHLGFWSAAVAGTFFGWLPLTGDQTFNATGEYTVSGISIPGTAT